MASLFAAVAAMNTAMIAASTAATLIAARVVGPDWAGLPGACGVLGTAAGALGSGMVIARHGRRVALLAMYGLATVGSLIAFVSAALSTIPTLMLGSALLGLGNGGAQLSRYVAADLYPVRRKGFGLSTIVWAGTVGAVIGPAVIAPTARFTDAWGLAELCGPIAFAVVMTALALVITTALPAIPRDPGEPAPRAPSLRSIRTALALPVVRAPLAAMVAAQAAMVAVMTMTPLQLREHGHGLDVVGWVLGAHMVGMFALAPLSGWFADRWGGRATLLGGIGTLAVAATTAVAAPTAHSTGLPVALFLLGYGWNLVFVGASSVLSRDLPPGERIGVQGGVDAVVWGSSAVASIGAGQLFGVGGYVLVAVVGGALAVAPLALPTARR